MNKFINLGNLKKGGVIMNTFNLILCNLILFSLCWTSFAQAIDGVWEFVAPQVCSNKNRIKDNIMAKGYLTRYAYEIREDTLTMHITYNEKHYRYKYQLITQVEFSQGMGSCDEDLSQCEGRETSHIIYKVQSGFFNMGSYIGFLFQSPSELFNMSSSVGFILQSPFEISYTSGKDTLVAVLEDSSDRFCGGDDVLTYMQFTGQD